MKRIYVFAWNKEDKLSFMPYKGHFDGENFHPKLGFMESIEELKEFDYVELFGPNGMLSHSPNSFNGNILEKMKSTYIGQYGEEIELF